VLTHISLLSRPIPDELLVTNISTADVPAMVSAPSGLIHPIVDGEKTSYFEWLGAGTVEARSTAGAMHRIDHEPRVSAVRFGFDDVALYVRVDAAGAVRDLLRGGEFIEVSFLNPGGIRLSIGWQDGGPVVAARRA
jgi:hypothetical protein